MTWYNIVRTPKIQSGPRQHSEHRTSLRDEAEVQTLPRCQPIDETVPYSLDRPPPHNHMPSVNVHCCIVNAMYIIWDHIKHDNWVQRNGTLCIVYLNDEWEIRLSYYAINSSFNSSFPLFSIRGRIWRSLLINSRDIYSNHISLLIN